MNTIQEIAEILKNIKSAVIFTHMRPDGDTVGSGMALSRALTLLGVKNEVLNEGDVPKKFDFLEGIDQIKTKPSFDAEAFICVDSSEEARLGALQEIYLAGARNKITVNIDHHVSNTRYAKYNYVKNASSNCENMVDVIEALGVTIDKPMANFLMLGMITDSGNFTHSDVNGDTFRHASAVADGGADVNAVYYHVFKKQPRNQAELYAYAISRLRFYLQDRLAFAVLTKDTMSQFSATSDMTEGIVDYALSVDTVEVSIALMEQRAGQYKASLRSKGKVNVNEVASLFGGGGHILASGCMLHGDLEEIIDRLCYAVSQRLEVL